jgi:Domain of unknown function (DUF4112)
MSDAIERRRPVDPDLPGDPSADPDLAKKLARVVTSKAVDRALGDDVSPELKKQIASQIEPWAERLAYFLDDWIRIPGTNIKFGLDAVVGLVPGVGDLVTGTGSVALLLLALKRGVPTAGLLRMIFNIGMDVVGGAIPVLGDFFDVAWRSNRKNLDVIKRYTGDPDGALVEPSSGDKLLVGVGITLAVLGVVVPLVVGIFLGASVFSLFGS